MGCVCMLKLLCLCGYCADSFNVSNVHLPVISVIISVYQVPTLRRMSLMLCYVPPVRWKLWRDLHRRSHEIKMQYMKVSEQATKLKERIIRHLTD